MIDITDLNKPSVLIALYDNSKQQGMGVLHDPKPLTLEDAEARLQMHPYIDYLNGKVLKVDLSYDSFDPSAYDEDNGEGAAQRAIDQLRNEE